MPDRSKETIEELEASRLEIDRMVDTVTLDEGSFKAFTVYSCSAYGNVNKLHIDDPETLKYAKKELRLSKNTLNSKDFRTYFYTEDEALKAYQAYGMAQKAQQQPAAQAQTAVQAAAKNSAPGLVPPPAPPSAVPQGPAPAAQAAAQVAAVQQEEIQPRFCQETGEPLNRAAREAREARAQTAQAAEKSSTKTSGSTSSSQKLSPGLVLAPAPSAVLQGPAPAAEAAAQVAAGETQIQNQTYHQIRYNHDNRQIGYITKKAYDALSQEAKREITVLKSGLSDNEVQTKQNSTVHQGLTTLQSSVTPPPTSTTPQGATGQSNSTMLSGTTKRPVATDTVEPRRFGKASQQRHGEGNGPSQTGPEWKSYENMTCEQLLELGESDKFHSMIEEWWNGGDLLPLAFDDYAFAAGLHLNGEKGQRSPEYSDQNELNHVAPELAGQPEELAQAGTNQTLLHASEEAGTAASPAAVFTATSGAGRANGVPLRQFRVTSSSTTAATTSNSSGNEAKTRQSAPLQWEKEAKLTSDEPAQPGKLTSARVRQEEKGAPPSCPPRL